MKTLSREQIIEIMQNRMDSKDKDLEWAHNRFEIVGNAKAKVISAKKMQEAFGHRNDILNLLKYADEVVTLKTYLLGMGFEIEEGTQRFSASMFTPEAVEIEGEDLTEEEVRIIIEKEVAKKPVVFETGKVVTVRKNVLTNKDYNKNAAFVGKMFEFLGEKLTLKTKKVGDVWAVEENEFWWNESFFEQTEPVDSLDAFIDDTPLELTDLNQLVINWAKEKELDKAAPEKQFLKVAEEFGEIGAALARKNQDDFKDAIGDTIVTLIVLAEQTGTNITECLQLAYDVIKGRTGKMIDGVFVKSEDLK